MLDLDLLLYDDLVQTSGAPILPHPRMHERAFVLVPLLDIAADILIPGQGSARDALSRAMTTEMFADRPDLTVKLAELDALIEASDWGLMA